MFFEPPSRRNETSCFRRRMALYTCYFIRISRNEIMLLQAPPAAAPSSPSRRPLRPIPPTLHIILYILHLSAIIPEPPPHHMRLTYPCARPLRDAYFVLFTLCFRLRPAPARSLLYTLYFILRPAPARCLLYTCILYCGRPLRDVHCPQELRGVRRGWEDTETRASTLEQVQSISYKHAPLLLSRQHWGDTPCTRRIST